MTTPGTSFDTATPRTVTTFPTDGTVVSHASAFATCVRTDSGGGPSFSICLPMPMSMPICEPLMPARVATMATRATTVSTTESALVLRGGAAGASRFWGSSDMG